MTTFQKPQALKAALKMALYGPAGSGKTFTALLVAEGLARHSGKRIAYCDTEHGTAFYGQEVAQRGVHPEAFDFDVLYTKSITQVLDAVRGLDQNAYGVLVIDSISHLWDAAIAAYTGKKTKGGGVPLFAWTSIKKPYKELMHLVLSSPVHVLLCGRQGNDFAEDESGELKNVGYKMRAEGETAYEPDVLLRLESHKPGKKTAAVPTVVVEKDRSGILGGKIIAWPSFDNLAKPLLGLLGTTQAALLTDDEVGVQDAEALARQEREQAQQSAALAGKFTTRMSTAETVADLQQIGGELTTAVKARLTTPDLAKVRKVYGDRLGSLKQPAAPTLVAVGEPGRNGS
jgi:AAA domain-containing protein